jgi:hypothetical protein
MNSPPWDAARGPALLPSTPRVTPQQTAGSRPTPTHSEISRTCPPFAHQLGALRGSSRPTTWNAVREPALLPSTPRVDPAANRGAMRRRCTGAPQPPCHGGSREILPPCFCSHQPCLCGASWQFHTDQHSTRSTTRDARPPGSRLSSPPRPGALLLVSRISSSYPSPPWFLRRFDRWQRDRAAAGKPRSTSFRYT